MTKNLLVVAAVAGIAVTASAQISNPAVVWQVSTDGGASWGPAAVVSGGVVKVRGLLSWDRGGLVNSAFAAIAFDGKITGCGGESTGAMIKPLQQSLSNQAGAGVNLGTGELRFSRTTDSGAAGSNTNFWIIGQDANTDTDGDGIADSFPNQNTSDPVTFVMFDLNIDGSANHVMTVSSVLSNVTSQKVSIWTNESASGGSTTRFLPAQVGLVNATITVVVPTSGPLTVLALGGLVAARRRR